MNSRTRQPRLHGGLLLSGFCVVVVALGCNQRAVPDYAGLGLAEVSGTIRLDNTPLANAHVIFESPDETFSSAKTDINGKYTLMFNSEQSGVLTGQKIVRIQLQRISYQGDDEDAGDDKTNNESQVALEIGTGSPELPRTYHRESQLTAQVVAGAQTINFNLKSDGTIPSTHQ